MSIFSNKTTHFKVDEGRPLDARESDDHVVKCGWRVVEGIKIIGPCVKRQVTRQSRRKKRHKQEQKGRQRGSVKLKRFMLGFQLKSE